MNTKYKTEHSRRIIVTAMAAGLIKEADLVPLQSKMLSTKPYASASSQEQIAAILADVDSRVAEHIMERAAKAGIVLEYELSEYEAQCLSDVKKFFATRDSYKAGITDSVSALLPTVASSEFYHKLGEIVSYDETRNTWYRVGSEPRPTEKYFN